MTTTTTTLIQPLALARSLRSVIELNASEGDRLGTMAPDVVAAIRESGLFDVFLPEEVGGQGSDLMSFFEVIEELSRSDASTGNACLANMLSATYFASALGEDAVAEVFKGTGPARTVTAASLDGPGNVKKVEGGYLVSVDKTYFASGSGHADWIGAGGFCEFDDGTIDRVIYLVPRANVEFLGDWDVFGLSGTGSFSFKVPEQFVAEEYTWRPSQWTPLRGQTDLRVGLSFMAVTGHVGVGLGTARRSLEELVKAMDSSKPRPGGVPAHRDSDVFLYQFAEIDAKYRSVRAYAIEGIRAAVETVRSGQPLTPEQDQRAIQVNTYAAHIAEEVAKFAFVWSGSAGLSGKSHLGRNLRDALVENIHVVADPHTLTASARTLMDSYR